MKIIVTGSAGFIGQHLTNRLIKEGHDVISWDVVTGQDICDPFYSQMNVDAVFHLACPVDPSNYKEVFVPTVKASSIGTLNMLELSLRNSAKFLYVSSSEVYGLSEPPFRENEVSINNHLGERSYYDVSKAFGEMLTMNFHRFYGLDVRIVRPFNIYGPDMRETDSRVVPAFFRKKRDGEPLTLINGGNSTRTFCYIDDLIDGLLSAMFNDGTNGEVFNLGTKDIVSMADLAKKISDNVIHIGDERLGEQIDRWPDLKKAETLLDWQPKVTLDEGLRRTWQSYQ